MLVPTGKRQKNILKLILAKNDGLNSNKQYRRNKGPKI